MATTVINTIVSKKELHFQPGGKPATFEVSVVNGSDRFASFQVELIAAGAAANRSSDWYSISPTFSSKKPPGAATTFLVAITDTPVAGFVGLMNVRVRAFSMELPDESREILRLIVERGTGSIPLKLELPVKQFQVYPGDRLEVPVRVYNPGQLLSNALLTPLGIDLAWLPTSLERRLQVPPGKHVETTFIYQPPFGANAPSQVYPFTLEVTHNNGPASRVEGSIEVLPMGFLDFECHPKTQQIPEKLTWKFWQSHPVLYTLQFHNASNVLQEASIELGGEDRQKCAITVTPPIALVEPEQTVELLLTASKKRPLLGTPKKLLLEVAALWSQRRVDTRNETQTLQLVVKPILPLWLQLIGALGLLWLLWWLSWLNPKNPIFGHQQAVNSVQFNGVGERIITGANDRKIIEWNVDGFFNPFVNPELRKFPKKGNRFFQWLSRLFGAGDRVPEKAVRVLRYRPVNNNFIAAGLENGEIQLWDLLHYDRQEPLESFVYEKDDRVFALEFTQDSRSLFSGHGSGLVLRWNLLEKALLHSSETLSNQPTIKQFNFAVYALKLIGKDDRNLAVAGRYNRLVVWNWADDREFLVPYREGSQDDYIYSINTAQFNPELLATADNQGYITLWNMAPCLNGEGPCERLEQWNDGHDGKPVRSVSLSESGCYLLSGGNDGRVMLWPLNLDGTRAESQGIEIFRLKNKQFNSVDLKIHGEKIDIVAGSNDREEVQVKSIKRFPQYGCDLLD